MMPMEGVTFQPQITRRGSMMKSRSMAEMSVRLSLDNGFQFRVVHALWCAILNGVSLVQVSNVQFTRKFFNFCLLAVGRFTRETEEGRGIAQEARDI